MRAIVLTVGLVLAFDISLCAEPTGASGDPQIKEASNQSADSRRGPVAERIGEGVRPPERRVTRTRHTGYEYIHSRGELPPNLDNEYEALPVGVPISHYSVHNNGSPALSRSVATEYDPIIYLNDRDSGWFAPQKASDVGNFTSVQMSMGNGFLVGDRVTSYSLTVYNSSEGTEPATVRLSLWDGDPAGIEDTALNDPPQEIAGTTCTWTDLAKPPLDYVCEGGYCSGYWYVDVPCASDDDCNGCPGLLTDDYFAIEDPWAPETETGCLGLYDLVCTLDPGITMPTKRPWLKVEVLEGCRVGARLGFPYWWPKVASGGGAGGCAELLGPCGDFIEEFYG